MIKEAMKLALDALQNELSIDGTNNEEFNASAEQMYAAIKALEEALAKQEQGEHWGHGGRPMTLRECMEAEEPQQRKPLTDEQIMLSLIHISEPTRPCH
jgi:hypothetical protein